MERAEVRDAVVEKAVVGDVDEKLRAGGMRIRSSRHGKRAGQILQAVVCLVVDRCAAAFTAEPGSKTAALDHEIVDYAVKQGAVVESLLDIILEIARRDRRLVVVEFYANGSEVGLQRYHGIVPGCGTVVGQRPVVDEAISGRPL